RTPARWSSSMSCRRRSRARSAACNCASAYSLWRSVAATNPHITPALSVERLAGTFPGDLGVELTEIADEQVRGRLRVDRRHLHPGGFVHAGAWVGFADTVAAWG